MKKEELLLLMEEIEKEKRENRFFEKVSFEEFSKGVKKNSSITDEEELRKLYDDLPNPCRSTLHAGGYDFYAPYDFVLKPNETIVVPTGFRVHMNNDEIFNLFIRSGTGFKYNVRLSNQVGVIDADYFGNSNNEGHMFASFTNHGTKDWVNTTKGLDKKEKSKMVQGIFMPYYLTKDDESLNIVRNGGFGSTNKEG
jgi:dUTP pyrophosphatase